MVPVARKVRLFVEIAEIVSDVPQLITCVQLLPVVSGLEVNIADDGVQPNTLVSVCV